MNMTTTVVIICTGSDWTADSGLCLFKGPHWPGKTSCIVRTTTHTYIRTGYKLAQCTGRAPHLASTPQLTQAWPRFCVCVGVCARVSDRLAILRVGCQSTHYLLPTTEEGEEAAVTWWWWWGSLAWLEGRDGGQLESDIKAWVCVFVCVCILSLPPGVAWSIKFTLKINDLQMIYKQVSVPSLRGCQRIKMYRGQEMIASLEKKNMTTFACFKQIWTFVFYYY